MIEWHTGHCAVQIRCESFQHDAVQAIAYSSFNVSQLENILQTRNAA